MNIALPAFPTSSAPFIPPVKIHRLRNWKEVALRLEIKAAVWEMYFPFFLAFRNNRGNDFFAATRAMVFFFLEKSSQIT